MIVYDPADPVYLIEESVCGLSVNPKDYSYQTLSFIYHGGLKMEAQFILLFTTVHTFHGLVISESSSTVSITTPKPTCFKAGLCLGHLIEVKEGYLTQSDCLQECKQRNGCRFASYHEKARTCTLSKACTQIVLENQSYSHSMVTCEETCNVCGITTTTTTTTTTTEPTTTKAIEYIIMTIGGKANLDIAKTVETFSINSEITCNQIDYPLDGHFGFVSGFIEGIPGDTIDLHREY